VAAISLCQTPRLPGRCHVIRGRGVAVGIRPWACACCRVVASLVPVVRGGGGQVCDVPTVLPCLAKAWIRRADSGRHQWRGVLLLWFRSRVDAMRSDRPRWPHATCRTLWALPRLGRWSVAQRGLLVSGQAVALALWLQRVAPVPLRMYRRNALAQSCLVF
jgi:hypothetical protein